VTGPGGVAERTTMTRRDGLRGSTSDPRQCQPRQETGRRATARGTPPTPETSVSSLRKQGYQHSTTLWPTWALPWHIFNKPTPHPRAKKPWPTSGSLQPWWKKRARHPSLRRPHRVSIRVVDLIDLRTTNSPPSRRRSTSTTPTSSGERRKGRRPPRQPRQKQMCTRRPQLHRPTPP
jgi:hypothetical protein